MAKKSKNQPEIVNLNQDFLGQQFVQPVVPVAAAPRRPGISFRVMNNCAPVPVAKPADFIQLTPIVQPIPLVPYSTQTQPIAMFEEDGDM